MGPVHHDRRMHQPASCLHRRVRHQRRLRSLDFATAHISNIQTASSEKKEDWNHGNLCCWSLVWTLTAIWTFRTLIVADQGSLVPVQQASCVSSSASTLASQIRPTTSSHRRFGRKSFFLVHPIIIKEIRMMLTSHREGPASLPAPYCAVACPLPQHSSIISLLNLYAA